MQYLDENLKVHQHHHHQHHYLYQIRRRHQQLLDIQQHLNRLHYLL